MDVSSQVRKPASLGLRSIGLALGALVLATIPAWADVPSGRFYSPANILFEGVTPDALISGSPVVDDARSLATGVSDAFDGYGFVTLDPVGADVSVTFVQADCDVSPSTLANVTNAPGTTTTLAYVGNPTVLTCSKAGLAVGADEFTVTVTRTFQGSWVRFAVQAERTVDGGEYDLGLPVRFRGNYGCDNQCGFDPGPIPASGTTSYVTYDLATNDPVIFTELDGPAATIGVTGPGLGDDVTYDFTMPIDGSATFVVSVALVEYEIYANAQWSPSLSSSERQANMLAAVDCALTLSAADFGTEIRAGMCITGSAPGGGGSDGPAPILQQVQLGAIPCEDFDDEFLNWVGVPGGGWSQSWSEWANAGTGGDVCTRTLVYNQRRQAWQLGS